jgi:small conductance mechanosensitive channel
MEKQAWLGDFVVWLSAATQMKTAARIAVILVLSFLALKLVRLVSTRLFEPLYRDDPTGEIRKRSDTLSSLFRHTVGAIVVGVAFVMVLGEFGVEIGPILTAAGIVGVAIGFGSQQLVQDVISGFFILLEDQVRVGDVVQTAGKSGMVERITLRMIELRDISGNVHFVRNGQIDVVTNMTKEYSRYVFDIGVAYREDVDEVIEVIKGVDEELRNDPDFGKRILEPIEVLGLDEFGDSAVVIKARTKTVPVEQWAVGREIKRRLKKRFDELDIEIPFPHVTLYVGRDKKGEAPPLRVSAASV